MQKKNEGQKGEEMETLLNSEKQVNIKAKEEVLQSDHHLTQSHSFAGFFWLFGQDLLPICCCCCCLVCGWFFGFVLGFFVWGFGFQGFFRSQTNSLASAFGVQLTSSS